MSNSIERKKEACCYFEDLELSSYNEDTSITSLFPVDDQRVYIDDYIYTPEIYIRDDLSELLDLYEPSNDNDNYSALNLTRKHQEQKKQSVWKRFIFLFAKDKYKSKQLKSYKNKTYIHANGSLYM